MPLYSRVLVGLAIIATLTGCEAQFAQVPEGQYPPSIVASRPGDKSLVKVDLNGQPLILQLASSEEEKIAGLSGLSKLPYQGMYFEFTPASRVKFWMKDMRFAIDIIWINNGRIVSINPNVQPQKVKSDSQLTLYDPGREVDAVIEISAGQAKTLGLKQGTSVRALGTLTPN